MTRRIVITGTDTDVGKTYVTAVLAKALGGARVVKPVQSGDDSDVSVVDAIVGLPVAEQWVHLALPLAPETAALQLGVDLPTIADHVTRLRALEGTTLVEGSGGVTVRMDLDGGTIADLAVAWGAEVVVVTRDTLGTLNHTQLTVDHLRARGLEPVLAIGAATPEGELNRRELVRLTGCPIVATVPLGDPAHAWIDPHWP